MFLTTPQIENWRRRATNKQSIGSQPWCFHLYWKATFGEEDNRSFSVKFKKCVALCKRCIYFWTIGRCRNSKMAFFWWISWKFCHKCQSINQFVKLGLCATLLAFWWLESTVGRWGGAPRWGDGKLACVLLCASILRGLNICSEIL